MPAISPYRDVDEQCIASCFHSGDGDPESIPLPPDRLVPGFSVVICTHRRAKSLERFLDSLSKQDLRPQRLIIVDSSSDEASEAILRNRESLNALAQDVLYFRVSGGLRGLTRQRNFGLRWVNTEAVTFFDDDIVLLPGCLREMERAFHAGAKQIVGVTPFLENEHAVSVGLWTLRWRLRMVSHLRPGTYHRSGISIPFQFIPAEVDQLEVDWIPGCAGMWKTALVRDLGFFQDFSGYSQGEDLEFSLRAAKHGKLLFIRSARVLHMHESGGRPNHYQLGYMAIYNRFQIHKRCIQGRTWKDVAWFTYAWVTDSIMLVRMLVRPRMFIPTFRQLAGRAKATLDLLMAQ